MDFYKDFLQRLRRIEIDEAYLLLAENITQKSKQYVLLLRAVKFEDGFYHTYYGEVKRIIASFMVFYTTTVDEMVKEADKYSNICTKDDLLWLVERTMSIQQSNHVEFGKEFLPVKSAEEKQIYDEIDNKFGRCMKKLHDIKAIIDKLDKQFKVDNFAKEHFTLPLINTHKIFDFVLVYLGMMLVDSVYNIRVSLEEILLRLTNNLTKIQDDCEEGVNQLLQQLYEKNKECTGITRRSGKYGEDLAEVNRSIDTLRMKIELNQEDEIPTQRLVKEVQYWSKRIEEFGEVAGNITRLKAEQESVIKSEKTYNSLVCLDLPGSKKAAFDTMGINLTERKEYIERQTKEEARSLITFFAVRGTDRITYLDNVGPYYVDEFNHQVYVFDYGLGIYHINCEGNFREYPDPPYRFDKHGRYVNVDGEKLYQNAPCTSQYNLGKSDLLTKITKDCGHSERLNKKCRMEITDPTDVEILPDFDPMDIRRTLDSDTVRYLWDSFGSVLPEALFDVGKARPRNPIHFLAHKLIHHKYRRTAAELHKKEKEAKRYRAHIFKEREEKAKAASKAWLSKQVKRRKPEESDDAELKAVYDAYQAEQMFLISLDYLD